MIRAILVKSCQRFSARRHAVESTWAAKLTEAGVPIFFCTGGHSHTRVTDNLLELDTGDSYNDNSFKVRAAVQLLLINFPFDFLFICDDDTFIHPERWLAFEPRHDFVGLSAPPMIWWAHGGAGWYMSRHACQLFVDGVTRNCSWDDRLASEILRKHSIEIDNHPQLFSQWDADRVTPHNQLITCHHVHPAEMRKLYQESRAY